MRNASGAGAAIRARRAVLLLLFGAGFGAWAQDNYPSRPLRLIVAFAPGSGNDVIARLVGAKLADALGQPVVVENRAGAGGVVGTEAVARAAPDGHTLGLGTSSQLVMNPALYRSLPFDVERDLAMVGLISRTPMVLAAKRDVPAKDLAGLIAYARANPGKLAYGSGGNGSISHIVGESFKREAGIDLVHVPYKGNGPAMNDLVGGQIDLVFDGFSTSGPLMKKGSIRVLAVHGQRHPGYPEVPTFAEMGLAKYEAYTWNCLFVPRGTPRVAIERLGRDLARALADADIRTRIAGFGAEILPSTPESAEAFAAAQRARWIPAVRGMNLKLD